MELELGVPTRRGCSLLILGYKAEVGLSTKRSIRLVGSCRRVNPATTSNESSVWIVDYDIMKV